MKKAAPLTDYLGINHYQSNFLAAYDGENDIHHNGTGDKGTKRFRLKGVGERKFKKDIQNICILVQTFNRFKRIIV